MLVHVDSRTWPELEAFSEEDAIIRCSLLGALLQAFPTLEALRVSVLDLGLYICGHGIFMRHHTSRQKVFGTCPQSHRVPLLVVRGVLSEGVSM